MSGVGTDARPLRVAIVGTGPSGFFAAGSLLRADLEVRIDLIDRLPTPFGLVRSGVAPDHQKMKKVVRAFEKTAADPRCRFFGHVKLGEDVQISELLASYDQVILAVGTHGGRELGIDGEDLAGSHSATEFVGWYNGHPDHQRHAFDLSCKAAVVVGIGNVALDVARVLVQDREVLAATDVPDGPLQALRDSQIEDVYLLGRRGAAQAAFTPAEIREIEAIEGVDLVVRPEDAELDALSAAELEANGTKRARDNVSFLQSIAGREPTAPRRVHLRLCTSPVAVLGEERVEGVKLGKNELVEVKGRIKPRDTGERSELACGLFLTAVGYRGASIPDVPFEDWGGTIPNHDGRVVDGETPVARLYVVGWAKRGPTGLIGDNRADSKATVAKMLEDVPGLDAAPRDDLALGNATTWADWEQLDASEVDRGGESGKLREKFTRVEAMLDAIKKS